MRPFRDIPIKQKLTLVIMLTSAIALVLTCLTAIGFELIRFRSAIVRDLSAQADIIAANSAAALAFNYPREAGQTLTALQTRPEILSARIYKPDGQLFAEYLRPGASVPLLAAGSQFPGHSFEGGQIALSQPILFGSDRVGLLSLRADLREQRARLYGYSGIVLAVMLTSGIVALYISARLQRVISEPILALTNVARTVTKQKDYSLRAQPAGRDEIGVLIEGFNEMLAQIQERERALRESEARLRLLNEQVPAGIWTTDRELRFTSATGSALHVLNLRLDEIVGLSLSQFFSTTDENFPSIAAHRRALAGERVVLEMSWGGREWRAHIEPLADVGGKITGCIGVALDMTETKKAEEQLRDTEQRFRQVAESIREVFWMTDLEKTRMIYVSPGYEEIWGRTCASLYESPRNWIEAIHPEDRDRVLEAALRKQVSGDYDEEYRIVRSDGSIRWIRDRAFPVHDASGKIYRIAGIAEDVTVRKQATEAVRESEERFRTLFEFAPIGIALHSADGKILQTNRAYQEMVGYGGDELVRLGVKKITHADDVADGQRLFEDLRTGVRDFYQREKRYVRKDGRLVWAQSAASAVRNADGKLRFIVSMVEDITEHKQLEEEILNISEREQARIGHDIHDGLCQHLVSTAFVSNRLAKDLSVRSLPEAIQADRISALLDDAITQARQLARGLYPVKVETEGLASALQELATSVSNRFKIGCALDYSKAVAVHDQDVATHLYRIVQEAVQNAVRHGRAGQIVIRLARTGDKNLLTIEDDGVGIAKDRDGSRGLGLHIMAYRAGIVGGTLNVGARTAGGTIVSCTFNSAASSRR